MCHYYSEQLLMEGDVRKAAIYALSAGRSSRAVEMFISQQMHRESVALSRCIYQDDSSEMHESLSLWATSAVCYGNMELAAKCYLANGRVAEAARILGRRSDVQCLKVSADLAAYAGLGQLAAAYLKQAAEIDQALHQPPSTMAPVDEQQELVINEPPIQDKEDLIDSTPPSPPTNVPQQE